MLHGPLERQKQSGHEPKSKSQKPRRTARRNKIGSQLDTKDAEA